MEGRDSNSTVISVTADTPKERSDEEDWSELGESVGPAMGGNDFNLVAAIDFSFKYLLVENLCQLFFKV